MYERAWFSCHISHRISQDHIAKKDKEIIYLQKLPDRFMKRSTITKQLSSIPE